MGLEDLYGPLEESDPREISPTYQGNAGSCKRKDSQRPETQILRARRPLSSQIGRRYQENHAEIRLYGSADGIVAELGRQRSGQRLSDNEAQQRCNQTARQ